MYKRKQTIDEKIQLAISSAHDLSQTQLDKNSAGDHDENQVDEYSDRSDSSDSEIDIDNKSENDLIFLRTNRPGCRITINTSIF